MSRSYSISIFISIYLRCIYSFIIHISDVLRKFCSSPTLHSALFVKSYALGAVGKRFLYKINGHWPFRGGGGGGAPSR